MPRFYIESWNNSWLLIHDGKVICGGPFNKLFKMMVSENYYYWKMKHRELAKDWPPHP